MIKNFKKKKISLNLRQFTNEISNLLKNNVNNSWLESRIILSHFFDISMVDMYLFNNIEVDPDKIGLVFEAVNSRLKNKPLEYIIGYKFFRYLKLRVDENVLIPRNETEEIVDIVKKLFPKAECFLDIGTGSGAIALSIAKEIENSTVYATDISKEAINIAKTNANENDLKNRVQFELNDLFPSGDVKFDVIISNPPYIDLNNLKLSLISEEIYFEPKIALFAENKGLFFYEKILLKSKDYLKFDGSCIFEVGFNQSRDVIEIGSANGFRCFALKDIFNVERFVICTLEMIK
jgi:release factor glutamine methyltransferase